MDQRLNVWHTKDIFCFIFVSDAILKIVWSAWVYVGEVSVVGVIKNVSIDADFFAGTWQIFQMLILVSHSLKSN